MIESEREGTIKKKKKYLRSATGSCHNSSVEKHSHRKTKGSNFSVCFPVSRISKKGHRWTDEDPVLIFKLRCPTGFFIAVCGVTVAIAK